MALSELALAQRRRAAQSKRPNRRPYRWHGPELAELQALYEAAVMTVDAITARFATNRGMVMRLAKHHGWKRRAPRLPVAARAHWNIYRKIHRIAGRAVALEAVAGIA